MSKISTINRTLGISVSTLGLIGKQKHQYDDQQIRPVRF
jgi:hypothetical protein